MIPRRIIDIGVTALIALASLGSANVMAAENGDIAFVGLKRDHGGETPYGLFVKRADGGVSRSLMNGPGDVDISADGRWIVASRGGHGQSDLYLVSTKGNRVRQLTDTPQRGERSPSFSPGARRIVFDVYAKHGRSGIATISRRGGPPRLISPGRDAISPDWSQGGEIVFLKRGRLTIVSPDGRGRHSFHTHLPGSDHDPSFSPDGSEVVFAHYAEGGVNDLYVLSVETKEVRPLVTDAGAAYDPSFSPDGGRVTFSLVPPGRDSRRFVEHLYGVDADDGSNLKRVQGLGAFRVVEGASWAEAR